MSTLLTVLRFSTQGRLKCQNCHKVAERAEITMCLISPQNLRIKSCTSSNLLYRLWMCSSDINDITRRWVISASRREESSPRGVIPLPPWAQDRGVNASWCCSRRPRKHLMSLVVGTRSVLRATHPRWAPLAPSLTASSLNRVFSSRGVFLRTVINLRTVFKRR